MKLEKFNKGLKIFIIVLAIVLVISIIAIVIFSGTSATKEKPIKQHECTKMGRFCSEEEIYKGVEVDVEVSDKKTERFYVISNTEHSMTLMMKKNIAPRVDWFDNILNIFGPETAMLELANRTKSWKNIDLIEDYKYSDNGLQTYISNCQNGTTEPGYDCSTTLDPTRGYISLAINKGVLTITANEIGGAKPSTFKPKFRARLATVEEMDALVYQKKLPTWLISNLDKNEGYWTISSSTSLKTNYSQGAIAVANIDKQPSIESLFVEKTYSPKFKIGIRPVITIEKEAVENTGEGH